MTTIEEAIDQLDTRIDVLETELGQLGAAGAQMGTSATELDGLLSGAPMPQRDKSAEVLAWGVTVSGEMAEVLNVKEQLRTVAALIRSVALG